jgi:hypothetical protein
MIDIFDIFAFIVFAVLIAAAFVIIVGLGVLPGWTAQQRGHPQAAAINVMSWLGLATGGILWLLAMIWAFMQPVGSSPAVPTTSTTMTPTADANGRVAEMQSRIDALESSMRELKAQKESTS